MQSLHRNLDDLFSVISRARTYLQERRHEDSLEPMRQDAVAHNLALVAHGLLGMQSYACAQQYDGVLSRWLPLFWDFTWQTPEKIDWECLKETAEADLQRLEADLLQIAVELGLR